MDDPIEYSDVDSRRFGRHIYRGQIDDTDLAIRAGHYDQTANIDMMIARVACDRYDIVQVLEASGFLLHDTLLYYKIPTARLAFGDSRVPIRDAGPGDRAAQRARDLRRAGHP